MRDPDIDSSKQGGSEGERRGSTGVVDVVEDKEVRTHRPSLASPTPGPLLCDHMSRQRSVTARVTAPMTPQCQTRTRCLQTTTTSLAAMTSYLSSLLWGTSQLDDAIGLC